ncbi:MAG: hypothetical protein LBQ24_05600 [Candidatus Peribacteria bacterium]|jgi:hypothetical protein|nr:hypothetical protein [Candidatus Peribacteria bacterium]
MIFFFNFFLALKNDYDKMALQNYFNNITKMEIQVKIHVNAPEAKDVSERLVQNNLEVKLDNYLKKYSSKEDSE